MKCFCGQPMRKYLVSLDDEWWLCRTGHTKPVAPESAPVPSPKRPAVTAKPVEVTLKPEPFWALTVVASSEKTAQPYTQRRDEMSNESNKTLADLNEKLFEQLDRLSVPDLKGVQLQDEILRTRAVSGIAREIVENAKLALEAQRCLNGKKNLPPMLGIVE